MILALKEENKPQSKVFVKPNLHMVFFLPQPVLIYLLPLVPNGHELLLHNGQFSFSKNFLPNNS